MLRDIIFPSDVELMVRTFYGRLLQHDEVKPVFEGIDAVSYTHLDVYKRQALATAFCP